MASKVYHMHCGDVPSFSVLFGASSNKEALRIAKERIVSFVKENKIDVTVDRLVVEVDVRNEIVVLDGTPSLTDAPNLSLATVVKREELAVE